MIAPPRAAIQHKTSLQTPPASCAIPHGKSIPSFSMCGKHSSYLIRWPQEKLCSRLPACSCFGCHIASSYWMQMNKQNPRTLFTHFRELTRHTFVSWPALANLMAMIRTASRIGRSFLSDGRCRGGCSGGGGYSCGVFCGGFPSSENKADRDEPRLLPVSRPVSLLAQQVPQW